MISKWPKILPALTAEQQARNHEFMRLWHEELAGRSRYGAVERFNHLFPVRHSRPGFRTTLEIGAGLGEHLEYEKLTPEQEANYYCNEYRENMAAQIRQRFPRVQTVVGDCQQRMDFADGFFDRILAVHVLEHLPNLPACIAELHRLINKENGRLLIVIPTEGSPAYGLARRLSAQRLWYRHFTAPYVEFYGREHINLVPEILEELHPYFTIERRTCFPLPFLPFVFCNLVIGLSLVPRQPALPRR
ncbi:methyltransferase domain-containing protein [Oleiharenicola lentus]|uniref:class I SAM-dependent methyltransferase n=1 Tax=Oleiharenicola lentus TaxID=2508720 RepID=UPI003F67EC01